MDAHVDERALDRRIAALAHVNHGVVDIVQLYAIGASRTQVGTRVRSGRLIRLYRGVYAVGHRQLTKQGWWLAAVRALGPGAVLSHTHAAALWDLRPPPGGRVHISVPAGGRAKRKGLIVHRTVALPPDHVTIRYRIPVTTPTRTLADLAATVPRPQLARALEAAEAHGLLDVPSVQAAAAGRPGAAALDALLAYELPHTRSDFEAAFLDLCDRYDLPRPAMNAQLHGDTVDAYWPDRGLVVELDSYRFHGTRAAFERDRERDTDLHARGMTTLRFTYRQVTTRQEWVAARLGPLRGSSSSRRSAA